MKSATFGLGDDVVYGFCIVPAPYAFSAVASEDGGAVFFFVDGTEAQPDGVVVQPHGVAITYFFFGSRRCAGSEDGAARVENAYFTGFVERMAALRAVESM
ncbi:MAG: hypothetical protein OWQ59_06225 [Alicyclobacillaceae bacterium]|nr:hypothetical protein [Alicyclobacillaceae bacterium]